MRVTDNNPLPGGAGDPSKVNTQRGPEAQKAAEDKNAKKSAKSQGVAKAHAAGAGAGAAPADQVDHHDRVQLSGLAAALRVETPGTPEREAKIDRLAREVESGRYRIDSKAVARRLIDDAFQK